jgi:NRPS condensation-like uncharacterized protein
MNEEPTEEIQFDLNEISKDDLINFMQFAHKHNYTINEAIVAALKGVIAEFEAEGTIPK